MGIKCPECKTENTSDSQFCKKCATPLPMTEDISVTKTMETPIQDLKRGTIFAGRYEIIEMLGSGGMGKVYRVFDKNTEEEIALKLLRPEIASNVAMIKRFRNELKYARKLTHKNVCRMYDLNEKDGTYYITMQYVQGEDLKSFIKRSGKLLIEKAIHIAKQICKGLEEAHNFGLVHRDLKPQNIMIDKEGNVRIMDFGVAYSLEGDEITEAGVIIGTPKYMSPEQLSGEGADKRSDLYSIGIILFEMVTGRVPFEGETGISIALKHRTEIPPDPKKFNPSIPESLSRIIKKCFEKERDNRYQSATQILIELNELVTDISPRKRAEGKLFRLNLIRGVIALASIIVLGLAFFFLLQKGKPEISSEQILILVADFQNQTTEKAFEGGALENNFGNGLKSAQFVSLFPREKAQKLVNQLDPSAEGRLDGLWAQLVSRNEKINVIIDGSIEPIDDGYQIRLWALDPISSEKMSEASEKITTRAEAFSAIDKLAEKIRLGLQYHLFSSISSEAVIAYWRGIELDKQGKTDEAKKKLLEAINIDPNFGSAYAAMVSIAYQEGNFKDAQRYEEEAMKRIDSMSQRERFRISGSYYLSRQNYKNAINEYNALMNTFPADPSGKKDLIIAHTNIALAYFFNYRMKEAYEHGLKAVELDPETVDYRYNLSWYALASGKFEKANQEARKALNIDPTYVRASVVLALTELAQYRRDEAVKIYEEMQALSESGASLACIGIADLALYEGRLNDAITLLNKGISSDIEKNLKFYANPKYKMLAQTYLLQGKNVEAVEAAEKALELYTGADTKFVVALIYMGAVQEDKARRIAEELGSQLQAINQAYYRLINGYLSLKRCDTSNALELFNESQNFVDTWLGRYSKARAYLEAGAFSEALEEFEICQERKAEVLSLFLNDIPTFHYLDSLDYFIGRALEALNKPDAVEYYTKFLKIKEKADPGIPEVEDVRKRLAALKID